MLKSTLSEIIQDSWRQFEDLKKIEAAPIAENSIPILWFGDIEKYQQSDLRILTIALNPSDREFTLDRSEYSTSYRFPKASELVNEPSLNSEQIQCYYEAMNEYFQPHNAPYKNWFNGFERPLNHLNASYYPDTDYARTAIHIDIYTPIATNPTWGKLSNEQKGLFLQANSRDLFTRLLKELDPQIILISLNEEEIKAAFNVVKDEADYKSEKVSGSNKFIYAHYKGQAVPIISGLNSQTPFARMDAEYIREHMQSIAKLLKID